MPFKQFPFLVSAFAGAAAVYFSLPVEPPLWVVPCAALAVVAIMFITRHRWSFAMLSAVIAASALFGFGWAQMRTNWVERHYAQPNFEHRQTVQIAGVVTWNEIQPRSAKLDIKVTAPSARPYLVRLYGRHAHIQNLGPGCYTVLQAEMTRRDGPIVIGGFEPRLDAWFAGRRGQGFIRAIDEVDCSQDLRLAHYLARWRLQLAEKYR